MTRHAELVHARYEAMLFAKSADQARRAARELVQVALGDDALDMPLDEALRECCRELRPADDPREQLRYEAEFVELGIWPKAATLQAATPQAAKPQTANKIAA